MAIKRIGKQNVLKYFGEDKNYPMLINGTNYTYTDLELLLKIHIKTIRRRLAHKKTFTAEDLKTKIPKWHKERRILKNTCFASDEDGSAKSKQFSQKWLNTKSILSRTNN